MKKLILVIAVLSTTAGFAQNKLDWHFRAAVDETFNWGDVPSTWDALTINGLAVNSGARAGVYVPLTNEASVDLTLGVSGSGVDGVFINKQVPLQLGLHYNILPWTFDIETEHRFNLDADLGIMLVRANDNAPGMNYNFGLAENAGFGASLDLALFENGFITFGYQHNFFLLDDYIDATSGSSLYDNSSRFYTAVTLDFNGGGKKTIEELTTKNAALQKDLDAAKAAAEAAAKEAKRREAAAKKAAEQAAKDAAEAAARAAAEEEAKKAAEAAAAAEAAKPQGYAVIIASFKDKEGAQKWMEENGFADASIIHAEDIGNYRVAYFQGESYGAAKAAADEVREAIPNVWIVKL